VRDLADVRVQIASGAEPAASTLAQP
jgi:hypothetical protein